MHPVHNVRECERIMEKGWRNRSTGATLMNAESSRSHSIFTICMEMITEDDEGEEHIRAGKLNLVDLAGSERQSKTGSTGDRLKEATKINLSLSALGNVISALVDGKSKHIPYRDSKLTRLLQDSLGGNTKTMMVACLSPADNNYEETLSTLRYANRAKNIKNKPKINEDPKDALLREYQEEIQKLKAMLMGQMSIPQGGFADVDTRVNSQSSSASRVSPGGVTRDELEAEKERLREEYDRKINDMEEMFEKEKVGKAKLQDDMSKLRRFYDDKLRSVDGQLAHLPTSAQVLGEIEYADSEPLSSQTAAADVDDDSGTEDIVQEESRTNKVKVKKERTSKVRGKVDSYDMETSVDRPMSVLSVETEITGPEDSISEIGIHAVEDNISEIAMNAENGEVESESQVTQSQNGVHQMKKDFPIVGKRPKTPLNAEEAVRRRLEVLQQRMVGGENANNDEVKERHMMRINHAEEKRLALAEAIANMDDDGIMMTIYDNVQDELKAKNELLDREHVKIDSLESELIDQRSEFEFDRIDYLEDIRKQRQQIELYKALLDRIQPLIRKDCNYSNLDGVRRESKWDENQEKWILPKVSVEKIALPGGSSRHTNGEQVDDERLREKFRNSEDASNRYFQSRRSNQLLSGSPDPKINMREIRESYSTNGASFDREVDPMSKGLHAAHVHGQVLNDESGLRRPTRLEALPSVGMKKSRKKKSAYEY